MKKLNDQWIINHRAKGRGIGVAFSLNETQRSFLGNAKMYSLRVHTVRNSSQDLIRRDLYIAPHAMGYELNFKKPGIPTGELHVAYNVLDVQPVRKDTGGKLRCCRAKSKAGHNVLAADITHWVAFEESQSTLFGETERLLLPNVKGVPDQDPVLWVEWG